MMIDDLLASPPYATADRGDFLAAMREAVAYHRDASPQYRSFLDAQGFDAEREYALEEIPALPVGVFKEVELLTGSADAIKKKIRSSSTTGNKPSVVCLDRITIDRQRKALANIMADVIGAERRPFVILDNEATVKSIGTDVSSRGSAIRGFLPFATSASFALTPDLSLAPSFASENGETILFGFTWVVYRVMQEMRQSGAHIRGAKLLHIGGWKKLRDLAVGKDAFNALAEETFRLPADSVIDIYGMTEQLGTIYPDCPKGVKHVPLYSDVLVRGADDLRVMPVGEPGLLEFLTPVPHSYPGIAVLTDDIGMIAAADGCACGRKGKTFLFQKRQEEAELKGCGDTL
jgi:phenylacetate-coenzyme A ligase PaaK-like adenylate-forming protein